MKRWCRLWGPKKTSFQKITWELLYQYLCDIALQKWSASRYCRIQVVKAWDLRQPAKQFWMSKGFPRACKNLLRGFVSDWASLVQIIIKTDQTRHRERTSCFYRDPGLLRSWFSLFFDKVAKFGVRNLYRYYVKGNLDLATSPYDLRRSAIWLILPVVICLS